MCVLLYAIEFREALSPSIRDYLRAPFFRTPLSCLRSSDTIFANSPVWKKKPERVIVPYIVAFSKF